MNNGEQKQKWIQSAPKWKFWGVQGYYEYSQTWNLGQLMKNSMKDINHEND